MIIVSNTTPLSELAKIDRLPLLQTLFTTIAKQQGLVNAIAPLLTDLINQGTWINPAFYRQVLQLANEE